MSTYVFMKVLESAPRRYDRGMAILTLGRLNKAKKEIVEHWISPDDQVLDIGCGTGTLPILCARKHATVTAIDISPRMLAIAREKIQKYALEDRIELREMGIIDLDTHFNDESFDVITSTLTFSELTEDERNFALRQCGRILKKGGKLIIADEIRPKAFWARVLVFLFRLPFVLITYLLTQNSTRTVAGLERRLADANFDIVEVKKYLLGTLRTFVTIKIGE